MRYFSIFSLLFLSFLEMQAQNASIKGLLQDAEGAEIAFANVGLFSAADSSLVKVETTNEAGYFQMKGLSAGSFFLKSTYVGMPDFIKTGITLAAGQALDLGLIQFEPASVELAEAVVTASRVMVEVRPDRTVFNVEGTINSTGSNGLELLRKAPSVTLDNNNNINVLGRAGVIVYVDGKRLPLSGQDLANYLENLQADQIDRIDIITSPGAKYEAEGNAGILDIRLKKDKNLGANGSLSTTASQGRLARMGLNASGNYRNKKMNIFGFGGVSNNKSFNDMDFYALQNGLVLDETNEMTAHSKDFGFRLGTDFFLAKNHTLGFLATQNYSGINRTGLNRITLAQQTTPNSIDSILVATSDANSKNNNATFNVNYRFEQGGKNTVNFDLDYGTYNFKNQRYQPNLYYDASEQTLLSSNTQDYDTPSNIDIYTAKIDVEHKTLGGQLGYGSKFSKVISNNTFLVSDEINQQLIQNDAQSNRFKYDENVLAAYVSFARPLTKKVNFSGGVRAEYTDLVGDLKAFLPELQEPALERNYLNWFPSAGLTYQYAPKHTFSANYSRRINRPDYNVLNPFNSRLSELSYEKGNPRLNPEIVNNFELGYTLAYRYNFKVAYSKTLDQITRLIAPDDADPRAGYISWDNLGQQDIYSFNLSAPFTAKKWWDIYLNLSASYQDNQADYGNGAVVDVQAYSYSIYQQHSFKLPKGFKGEVSSWYSGPGVWGGVFKYDPSYSVDLGLSKKFLQDKLNVRVSVNDIFYQSYWSGTSSFDGLVSTGQGQWDSRRASINLNYNFGNQNVKSRKRKTGIEDEAGRVGG